MNDEFNNLSNNDNQNNISGENKAENSTPDSEYEVSFDSATGNYSYTPAPGNTFTLEEPSRNAFDTMNTPKEAPRKEKKKRSALVCVTAIAVSFAIIFSALAAGAFAIDSIIGKLGPSQALSSIDGPKLTVNKSDLEIPMNDVSKATYAAYDSTLLIEAYVDSSASTLAGTGSGVLWSADGYIVTCNHVVEGYQTIKVTFTDGTSFFAEAMANDPITDLAVLKISLPANSEILPVTVRDTSKTRLTLGETVIAIGNPLGYLTNTVTDGILSSLEREITVEGTNMVLMQISAAVNSGNSGGGLFDINGSLMGIVNAKIAGDSVEGIGFAIPIDTVIDVATQLIDKGYVSGRPQIGVNLVTITNHNYADVFKNYPELREFATTSSGRWGMSSIIPGIYVLSTSESIKYADGSEEKLKLGDRLYQIATDDGNFVTIDDQQSIQNFLVEQKVGDTIHLTVMRGGKALTVSVVLGEKTGA
ncbi:MAG: trypsin-like peptidase domain-containing protein [Clostridia bacterium]|nr:trypsin-like peptidase domain-containing protein [Clostridia bacterium]